MAQREGYLLVDHRASPGLSEDMARRMGVAPGSKLGEVATLTCCHCKTTQIKNPFRQRERERCPKCSYKYLCDFCYADMQHPDYVHTPFEKIANIIKGETSCRSEPFMPRTTPLPLKRILLP